MHTPRFSYKLSKLTRNRHAHHRTTHRITSPPNPTSHSPHSPKQPTLFFFSIRPFRHFLLFSFFLNCLFCFPSSPIPHCNTSSSSPDCFDHPQQHPSFLPSLPYPPSLPFIRPFPRLPFPSPHFLRHTKIVIAQHASLTVIGHSD